MYLNLARILQFNLLLLRQTTGQNQAKIEGLLKTAINYWDYVFEFSTYSAI